VDQRVDGGENNLNVEVTDEAGNPASDIVTVTYDPPTNPPTIVDGPEGFGWLSIMGIAILLVAIVILVTAMFVVYSRRRR